MRRKRYKNYHRYKRRKRKSSMTPFYGTLIIMLLVIIIGLFINQFYVDSSENLTEHTINTHDKSNIDQSQNTIKSPQIDEPIIDLTKQQDKINTDENTVKTYPPDLYDYELIEFTIFQETNQRRQSHGITPLIRDHALDKVADTHSLDMAENQYMDHVNLNGQDPTARGLSMGYECSKTTHIGLGENLSTIPSFTSYYILNNPNTYQFKTSEVGIGIEAVIVWMDSPGHRENILRSSYDRIGISVKLGDDYNMYMTQKFC